MERSAAAFVQVVDAGPRTHQSKQTLVVTVGSSVVQRGPGKANMAQFSVQIGLRIGTAQTLEPNPPVNGPNLPKLSFLLKSAPVLRRRLRHSRFLKGVREIYTMMN